MRKHAKYLMLRVLLLALIFFVAVVAIMLLTGREARGSVDTLQPVADGDRVDWDVSGCDPGEHYDCVDDPPGTPDENTYAYTSVDGEEEFFQLETTSLSDIDSVVLRFNAKKIGDGTAKLYVGWAYEIEETWWWWTDDSVELTTDWADYFINLDDDPDWTDATVNGRRFGVKSIYWDTTAWWDEDYDYRIKLSCGNHDEYSTDDFLGITGVNVTGAKFMDNGDDIRIVYQEAGESPVDLGRHLIGANTSTASIYWQVQATIPENENIGAQSDYKYFLYYGNSEAGLPETYTNTDCIDAPYSTGTADGLWHFEEASGTLYDETANDLDLTVTNSPTYEATGYFGGCLDWHGTDECASISETPNDGVITIEFWVNCDKTNVAILGYNNDVCHGTTYDRAFAIDDEGKVRWKVYDGAPYITVSTTTISPSTWYHIAGTIKTGVGNILFINGVAEDTAAGENGYNLYGDPHFIVGSGDDGGWGNGQENVDYFFDGKIDELCLHDATKETFNHVDNEATLSLGSEETTWGATPNLTQVFLIVYSAEEAEVGQVIIIH